MLRAVEGQRGLSPSPRRDAEALPARDGRPEPARRVHTHAFLSRLSAGDAGELELRSHPSRFGAGEVLLREGVSSDTVILLFEGLVKVSVAAGNGREVVLAIRGAGELLGELTAIDGARRTASVIALSAGRVGRLSAEEMRSFISERPYAAVALLQTLTRRLREADRARSEDSGHDGLGRVSVRLLELADRHGERVPEGVRIGQLMTQDELASWTCTSRQTVARALKQMRQLGWIATSGRAITLLDLEALHARAHAA